LSNLSHMLPSDLLATAEVAKELGNSVPTINRWVAEGKLIPAKKLPGRTGAYLFDRATIDALSAA
jgi:excisionase family DNA binding protein